MTKKSGCSTRVAFTEAVMSSQDRRLEYGHDVIHIEYRSRPPVNIYVKASGRALLLPTVFQRGHLPNRYENTGSLYTNIILLPRYGKTDGWSHLSSPEYFDKDGRFPSFSQPSQFGRQPAPVCHTNDQQQPKQHYYFFLFGRFVGQLTENKKGDDRSNHNPIFFER